MSKVLKASTVKIDENNVVNVEVMDSNAFQSIKEEKSESYPEKKIPEEEAAERSEQILREAAREAERIKNDAVNEAKKTIAEMRAEAEAELDGIKRNAYDQAYKEGRKKAEKEADKIIEEAEQIKAQALIEKNRLINSAEPMVVRLVTDIVKKLIDGAVELHPELILFLIKQGLSQTTITGGITIHVSQEDYEAVAADKAEILSMAEAGAKIEIIKDLSLNRSDCIIETQFGNIDCSLERQYEALKEDLYYICNNRFAESVT